MGKPTDAGDYTVFQTDSITFFVENKILEEYLADGKIVFHLDQYGSFELEVSEN